MDGPGRMCERLRGRLRRQGERGSAQESDHVGYLEQHAAGLVAERSKVFAGALRRALLPVSQAPVPSRERAP